MTGFLLPTWGIMWNMIYISWIVIFALLFSADFDGDTTPLNILRQDDVPMKYCAGLNRFKSLLLSRERKRKYIIR